MSAFDAVDLFAGPGGWDEGARQVGLRTVGLEWDHAACQTAVAAGHPRIRCDVAQYPTAPFVGIPGLIASPPCQAWSMAGKRKGEHDRAACHQLADRMAGGDDSLDWTEWEDERSPLVCQPVRWVRDLRPEWVALEEVPAVAGLWEHFARIFRGWGYSVWTGDLNSADYGVPQTRERRILMAIASWLHVPGYVIQPPEPTHSRDGDEGDLFGARRLKWVSMAEGLGPDWVPEFVNTPRESPAAAGRGHWDPRPDERPPVYVNGNQPNAGRRSFDEPAPTILFGHRSNDVRWVLDRPATTVVGSFAPDVISAPGYRTTTSRQNAVGSVRVTCSEAGVLQSFPRDYPWKGSKSKQHEQVGNAVPPRLAGHILAALTGASLEAAA